jgi:cbb3-type cytochrome oxidase maturation protein
MESLYLLIPVSVVLVFVIGLIFWWTLKSGQMEDLEGPAWRILMDDDRAAAKKGNAQGDDGEQRSNPDSFDSDQSAGKG